MVGVKEVISGEGIELKRQGVVNNFSTLLCFNGTIKCYSLVKHNDSYLITEIENQFTSYLITMFVRPTHNYVRESSRREFAQY